MVGDGPGIEGFVDLTPVASGGNSVVYKARQEELDRNVAIKVLKAADPSLRRHFDRERRALGRLSNHPGVVTIYESGVTGDGRPYLVIPWIESGSLQDRLDRSGPLEPSEAARIVASSAAWTLYSTWPPIGSKERTAMFRITARSEYLDLELTLGRHSQVLPNLTRLVEANPLDERLRGQLMLALYRAGRHTETLDSFKRLRTTLEEELGLDGCPRPSRPSPQRSDADGQNSPRPGWNMGMSASIWTERSSPLVDLQTGISCSTIPP
jgi:hypothetical protein